MYMNRQVRTERSKQWHDINPWVGRRQTRYEHRQLREYYRQEIVREVREFKPEMPDCGEPHWLTNLDGGPGEIIWNGGDHIQAYRCPPEAECMNCWEPDEYWSARDVDDYGYDDGWGDVVEVGAGAYHSDDEEEFLRKGHRWT